MMSRKAALLWVGAVALVPACLPVAQFECSDNVQCRLNSEAGTCDSGWCSYPDDDCDSGRRFHEHADPALAGTCVPVAGQTETGEPATGSGSTSDGGSSDGGGTTLVEATETGPAAVCGNGEVEDGEACDDENTEDDDVCNRWCQEPGAVVWLFAPSTLGRSVAVGVVAAGEAAAYVLSEVDGPQDQDVQVAHFDGTGAETVSTRYDTGLGDDRAGTLVPDGDRMLVLGSGGVAGTIVEVDAATVFGVSAQDDALVASHWDAGIVSPGGRVYVTGWGETTADDPDVRTVCYAADLSSMCGISDFAGPGTGGEESGTGLVWLGDELFVVGFVNPGPGTRADLFTQILDDALVVQSTQVVERSPVTGWSDVAIGPEGSPFTSGFYDLGSGRRQIRAGAFDSAGVSADGFIFDRGVDATDYGRAIAVDTIGNVIIVGELDQNPDAGTRDYEAFIGKYSPSFDEIWTRTLELPDARARAIAIDERDNIIVVGEHEIAPSGDASVFVAVLSP